MLVGLLFIFSGAMKFVMPYADMIKDAPVVFPHWFFLFIGVCEIFGGLGLILPWALKIKPGLTPLAAALLIVIMIGAVVISAMMSIHLAIVPAVVGILLALIVYGRTRNAAAA